MDSPGGSTPRSIGTPVRLTLTSLSRGQHHARSSHSSSLLEDVLAEKKMALMQSPEVIQFFRSVQASVQQRNKPASRTVYPEQTGCPVADYLATSKNKSTTAVMSSGKNAPSKDNMHSSALLTGSRAEHVDQQNIENRSADQEMSGVHNNRVTSTLQNAAPHERFLCSSSLTPAAADVQFVSVSAVIPGTVQYVLQHSVHAASTAPKSSSIVSPPAGITNMQHNPPVCSTRRLGDASTVGGHRTQQMETGQRTQHTKTGQMTQDIETAHSQSVSELSTATSRSASGLATSTPMSDPHLLYTAPVQIDSSRHNLIKQWLNANINSTDLHSGTGYIKESLAEK